MNYDLAKEARAKQKERIANEYRHTQNLAKAAGAGAGTGAQEKDANRTLAMTRTSTASMSKFHRVLDGEKKLRGVKRKASFPPVSSPHRHPLRAHHCRPNLTRLKVRRCVEVPQYNPYQTDRYWRLVREKGETTAHAPVNNKPHAPNVSIASSLAQQEREFPKAVQPGSPISAQHCSARQSLMIAPGYCRCCARRTNSDAQIASHEGGGGGQVAY